jgi:polyhydroxyalkanoate synthesis regulator phasin
MVMRDMKSGVQDVVKQRTETQRFVDTLYKQTEIPAPANEDFLRADVSRYSRTQLIQHIAMLKSKINNEFTSRQQLETLVANLQSAVTTLSRKVQQLEEKKAKK